MFSAGAHGAWLQMRSGAGQVMIHYELRCASGHGFDGWFPGSAAFDRQAGLGLLSCPVCASSEVRRAIMAPRVASGRAAVGPTESAPALQATADAESPVTPPKPMPDQLRATLQRLRVAVEQSCDYVGAGFADAARAMHEGASERRAIYGETTPAEAEALAEDGIEVSRIPWIPRADS